MSGSPCFSAGTRHVVPDKEGAGSQKPLVSEKREHVSRKRVIMDKSKENL
jgi:hypothetical protein